MLFDASETNWGVIDGIDTDIEGIESQIKKWQKQQEAAGRWPKSRA